MTLLVVTGVVLLLLVVEYCVLLLLLLLLLLKLVNPPWSSDSDLDKHVMFALKILSFDLLAIRGVSELTETRSGRI